MSASKFEIHLIVPSKLVGTIIELVEGEGILVSLNQASPTQTPNGRDSRYLGGRRSKGISGKSAVLEAISKGHNTYHSITTYLCKTYNFAEKSTSPVLSQLKADGLIVRDAKGNWSTPR